MAADPLLLTVAEPSLALQLGMRAALGADPVLAELIGVRIYDRVPTKATTPYVHVGDDQVSPSPADGGLENSVEIFSTVHVWSAAVGKTECKRVAGAVVRAVALKALDLGPNYSLLLITHRSTQYLDDPDGLTSHGVVTFRALVDEA